MKTASLAVACAIALARLAAANFSESQPGTIDTIPPIVHLPQDIEAHTVGATFDLSYTATDQGEGDEWITLHVVDEQGSVTPLADGMPNTGVFQWLIAVPEGTYHLEMHATDSFGNAGSARSNSFNILADVASTTDLPAQFGLIGAYPNPFNPGTTLTYSLDQTSPVNLSVYNLQGQLVATIVDGLVEAGQHRVWFDGSALSSGIYFTRLQSESRMDVSKITLLK
ncbi:MAG: T9SS type A sorting domain-containing protein [Caldilineaceae bacterium]|nr:T9SS type A sorting domain-containing protein [Caldilineaceae bacterium]